MRNPSAYVPNFLTLRYVAYCQNLKTLFLPKFSISNFHIGVRARGVAAWQILPARRRSAAACIPGLHVLKFLSEDRVTESSEVRLVENFE